MNGQGDPFPTVPFSWKAEGSLLTFGDKPYSGPAILEELSMNLRSWWARSPHFGLDEATYEVVSCTANRIELKEPNMIGPFVLTRISAK